MGKSYDISQPLVIENAIDSPVLEEKGRNEHCFTKVVHPKFKLYTGIAKP